MLPQIFIKSVSFRGYSICCINLTTSTLIFPPFVRVYPQVQYNACHTMFMVNLVVFKFIQVNRYQVTFYNSKKNTPFHHPSRSAWRPPSPIKIITEASITHQELNLRPITHHQTIMIALWGACWVPHAHRARAAMVAEVPCNLTPRHPPSQVVDDLPHYRCQARKSTAKPHRGRFPCLATIAEQIIYYLFFGLLGACRQAPYKFKNRMGRLCMGNPHTNLG